MLYTVSATSTTKRGENIDMGKWEAAKKRSGYGYVAIKRETRKGYISFSLGPEREIFAPRVSDVSLSQAIDTWKRQERDSSAKKALILGTVEIEVEIEKT